MPYLRPQAPILAARLAEPRRCAQGWDHQQRLVQPALEFVVVARDLLRIGTAGINLGTARLRGQRGKIRHLALTPPRAQGRRVHQLLTPARLRAQIVVAKHEVSESLQFFCDLYMRRMRSVCIEVRLRSKL